MKEKLPVISGNSFFKPVLDKSKFYGIIEEVFITCFGLKHFAGFCRILKNKLLETFFFASGCFSVKVYLYRNQDPVISARGFPERTEKKALAPQHAAQAPCQKGILFRTVRSGKLGDGAPAVPGGRWQKDNSFGKFPPLFGRLGLVFLPNHCYNERKITKRRKI